MNLFAKKFWLTLAIYSGTLFTLTTTAFATADRSDNKLSQVASENTLTLNKGNNEQITAHTIKEINGDKKFESRLSLPGVTITEQVQQNPNGHAIQENKVVVNIADNKSVEFIQQFDGDGRKISRSVIKHPISKNEANKDSDSKNAVISEGGRNDMGIKHDTSINPTGKITTITVSSDNFFLQSGTKSWALSASGGYGQFANATNSDGSTGIGRLALGRTLFELGAANIGLEAAIQNGVSIRPAVDENVLNALGGTPILATIKPVVELLPTFSRRFSDSSRIAGFIKLGIAYRLMTFDRDTLPNLGKISPDMHIGLSFAMSDNINLIIYYQVIFGGDPNITATMQPLPANNHGEAKNIPTQQSGLIGVAYNF